MLFNAYIDKGYLDYTCYHFLVVMLTVFRIPYFEKKNGIVKFPVLTHFILHYLQSKGEMLEMYKRLQLKWKLMIIKILATENMPIGDDIAAWAQRREHKPQKCAPGEDPKRTGENKRIP